MLSLEKTLIEHCQSTIITNETRIQFIDGVFDVISSK